jgi:hypothetical protein
MTLPEPPAEGPPCFRCEGVTEFHSHIVDPKNESVFLLYRCVSCQNQLWAPAAKVQELKTENPD